MEIPKVIHYCWFGGKPLPREYKKYIDTWRKFCPEYEIVEWNESNFNIAANRYVEEAYKEKKWAFVSDYARFRILYEYGGIYVDTDVEFIKSIEELRIKGPFMGLEKLNDEVGVNPGLGLGSYKGHEIYKEILDAYDKMSFINEDGSLNTTTVVTYVTDILRDYGFININDFQKIKDITLYPSTYLNPLNCVTGELNITEGTVTIHHYSGSWISINQKIKKFLKKIFGHKFVSKYLEIKRRFLK